MNIDDAIRVARELATRDQQLLITEHGAIPLSKEFDPWTVTEFEDLIKEICTILEVEYQSSYMASFGIISKAYDEVFFSKPQQTKA